MASLWKFLNKNLLYYPFDIAFNNKNIFLLKAKAFILYVLLFLKNIIWVKQKMISLLKLLIKLIEKKNKRNKIKK